MNERGFREFVKEGKMVPKGLDDGTIRSHIRIVEEFERFLSKGGKRRQFEDAKERDVRSFLKHLADSRRVSFDNMIGLLRYARFARNNDAIASLLFALNSDQLSSMSNSLMGVCGETKHREVLGDFIPPALGTSPKRMPKATKEFLDRLESGIGDEETREFLEENCPDTSPRKSYRNERRLFLSSKNLDDYLNRRRKRFIEELTTYMRNGTLFYTQRINDEVIDFVKGNPQIGIGERKGNLIIHTKIPYMTIDYLKEKNPRWKRYYYCHCPLAREAILSGERIPRNLCYCSAGYSKRPFEVALARPLRVRVMKSVIWGDSVCQFAIMIPREFVTKKRGRSCSSRLRRVSDRTRR